MANYLDSAGLRHLWGKIQALAAGKAAVGHSHDGRYYTEGAIDTKLLDVSDHMDAAKPVLLTIPAGRVAGDVNGDGKIDDTDVAVLRTYFNRNINEYSTEEERLSLLAADIVSSGKINSSDLSKLMTLKNGVRDATNVRDVLGVWTARSDFPDGLTYLFTKEIAVEGVTAASKIALSILGKTSFAGTVEAMDGGIRIYCMVPPLEDLTAQLSICRGGTAANGPTELLTVMPAPKSETVKLTAAEWDAAAKTQSVAAPGVSVSNAVTPTPGPASWEAAGKAGVRCTGQGENSLTFTCTTVPTEDLTYNVLIQEVQ